MSFETNKIKFNNKKEMYEQLLIMTQGLLDGEEDMIANLGNISALLYFNMEKINWAGFYLRKDNQLVLGPFNGKVACTRITIGKGVCGSAALEGKAQIVEDVHKFPGHIACDSASNSEIVIPIYVDKSLFGVLDIDSTDIGNFTTEDLLGLEKILEVMISKTKF